MNDERNNGLFAEYQKMAQKEENVLFGGRLGQYRYYDMDKVIEAALEMVKEELIKLVLKARMDNSQLCWMRIYLMILRKTLFY